MMKKVLRLLAVLTVLCLCFTACGTPLDTAAFGEGFRAENPTLFRNGECEHYLRYRSEGEATHEVYCIFSPCGYETRSLPHTVGKPNIDYYITMMENGCYYHSVGFTCIYCGESIYISVLCQKQDGSCSANSKKGCLDEMDFAEFLEGTGIGPAEEGEIVDWRDFL